MWKASFKSHPDKKTWKQNLCFLPLWFHSCWQDYPSCCCGAPSMIVEPVSSGFQCELKASSSPVTFQTFSIRLGLLRCSISWSEQASKASPVVSASIPLSRFLIWLPAPTSFSDELLPGSVIQMYLFLSCCFGSECFIIVTESKPEQLICIYYHWIFFLFLFVLRTNRNIKTMFPIYEKKFWETCHNFYSALFWACR